MSLGRFWNLRTKLVTVLGLVLAGTFLLQGILHQQTRQQLLDAVAAVSQEILEETVARLNGSEHRSRDSIEIIHRGHRTIFTITGRTLRAFDSRRQLVAVESSALEQMRSPAAEQERLRRGIQFLLAQAVPRQYTGEFGAQDPFINTSQPPSGLLESSTLLDVERNLDPDEGAGESIPLSNGRSMADVGRAGEARSSGESIDITPYLARVEGLFREAKFRERLATFGIFLVGFAAAWLLGARLIRPVLQVADGLQQVAAGDLEARVEVPGDPELAIIADQFNEMVIRLREGKAIEQELEKRERIQHMGDLAAGVAHDVRNPLNSIRLILGQVREEFVPEQPLERERFLRFTGDAEAEVGRLKHLVSDFLALAQPSSREQERIAPKEVIDEIYRLLANEASDKGVKLETTIEANLPDIFSNKLELKSAFLNVAINAMQACSPGGGSLRVEMARQAEAVEIKFVDDGIGIPSEHIDSVFLPYFTQRKGGTGLGLSIVKRIAERNGGSVEIESVEGEGTTVRFLLPIGSLEERSAVTGDLS